MSNERQRTLDAFGAEPDISYTPEGVPRIEVSGVGPEEQSVFPPEKKQDDLSTIRRGLTSGAIKGAPVAAAFAAGLPLSISAAAASGPLAPLTFVLGMGGSLYAGIKASETASNLAQQYIPEYVAAPESQEDMPLYRGAETFGLGAMSSLSAPFLSARTLATPVSKGFNIAEVPARVTNFFTNMTSAYGRAARKSGVVPKVLFTTGELASIGGAGAGSYAAERYFPRGYGDDPTNPTVSPEGVKFFFELTGGFLPALSKSLTRGVSEAAPFLDPRNWSDYSKKMGERQAEKTLYKLVTDPELQKLYNENPSELIKRLEETGLLAAGKEGTAAQFTGSYTLSALEGALARSSARFGGGTVKQGEDAMRGYKALIEAMVKTDNPALIQAAAQLERQRQIELMDARFAVAANELDQRMQRLTPLITRDPAGREISTRQAIGEQMEGAVMNALGDFRASENELYNDAFARMFRTARGGKATGKITPKTVVPQNAIVAFLESSVPLGQPGLNNVSSAMGQDLLKDFNNILSSGGKDPGLLAQNISTYKDGTLTRHYLENRLPYQLGEVTAPVPQQFLEGLDITRVPLAQLQTWRSGLLERGRVLRAQGQFKDARVVNKIADGLVKDMEQANVPELRQALSFTKTLHDYFSRAFPAEVTARNAEGGMRLSPEELVSNAFKTLGKAANETSLRMTQIEEALKVAEWEKLLGPGKGFAAKQRFEEAARTRDQAALSELLPLARQVDAAASVNNILDAQRRFFEQEFRSKFSTSQMANPLDPTAALKDRGRPIDFARISPAFVQKYVQDNRILLDKLGLTDVFQDIGRLENAFKFFTSNQNLAAKNIQSQAAFSDLVSPTSKVGSVDIVRDALASKDPQRRFNELIDMTGQVPGAREGLKNAVYSLMFERAGSFRKQTFPDPNNPGATIEVDVPFFNPEEVKRFMQPTQPGKPSVFGLMRSKGMLVPGEEARLKEILKRMEYIQRAAGAKQSLDQIVDPASPLDNLINRAAGATIGGSLVPSGPGSLVAAGAGSRAFQRLFESLPGAQAQLVLQEAAQDPKVMAALMRKAARREDEKLFARRVMDVLLSVGAGPIATATTNYLTQPTYEEAPPEAFGIQAQAPKRQLPAAPPSRGLLSSAAPRPQPGRPQAQGQPQPQARELLQRLFPFDTMLR